MYKLVPLEWVVCFSPAFNTISYISNTHAKLDLIPRHEPDKSP